MVFLFSLTIFHICKAEYVFSHSFRTRLLFSIQKNVNKVDFPMIWILLVVQRSLNDRLTYPYLLTSTWSSIRFAFIIGRVNPSNFDIVG